MASHDTLRLGEVEHLVLLAALRLDDEAYAVPIRALIADEAGVTLTRGSIYVTLDRLEEKGFVASAFSEPTGEPGGKARRIFRVPLLSSENPFRVTDRDHQRHRRDLPVR
jgi:DNA-binding PadR family transcriptional regulator